MIIRRDRLYVDTTFCPKSSDQCSSLSDVRCPKRAVSMLERMRKYPSCTFDDLMTTFSVAEFLVKGYYSMTPRILQAKS
jgi:hypothetical protein